MKFNKHGLAILYKEPIIHTTMATPRMFHYNSDVHYGSQINILGSRGVGKSMFNETLRNIWNGFQ